MNGGALEGILVSVAVGLLFTAVGSLLGRVSARGHNLTALFAISSVISSAVAWLAIAEPGRAMAQPTPRLGELILLFSVAGGLGLAGQLAFAEAIRHGHKGISWAISQAAMVAPVLFALAVWKDPIHPVALCGIALILVALTLLGRPGKVEGSGTGKWVLWAFAAFLFYGIGQTLNMVPSKWAGWTDAGHLRLPLFLTAFAIASVATALVKRTTLTKALLAWALAHAAISLTANFLVFRAFDLLAPGGRVAFVYPIAVGVSLLGMALVSHFAFKETTTRGSLAGLALAVTGVILLALR